MGSTLGVEERLEDLEYRVEELETRLGKLIDAIVRAVIDDSKQA